MAGLALKSAAIATLAAFAIAAALFACGSDADSGGNPMTSEDAGDASFDTTIDVSFDVSTDAVDVSDAAIDSDAPTDATDASLDARPDATDASFDAACPGDGGPLAIRVGAYCIDSTEVTNADYARFLAADAGAAPAPCAANASYVPGGGTWPPPTGSDSLPVVGVDWCDAYMYCAWIGKRLCGAIGGGGNPYDGYDAGQWHRACSSAGALVYPYGATYDPFACNGQDRDAGALVDAGSLSTCAGGASTTLRDMSGNVYEWEDSCDHDASMSDNCRIRGGGWLTPGPPANVNLSCTGSGVAIARGADGFVDVGFRCCGP
jgi:formylglycine-generating enzyme required for sulfatase activity